MNARSNRAGFRAGEFISQDAVRAAHGRRRRNPQAVSADARAQTPATAVTTAATATRGASSVASPTRPLRRWSVAELVARAGARPADGMSH